MESKYITATETWVEPQDKFTLFKGCCVRAVGGKHQLILSPMNEEGCVNVKFFIPKGAKPAEWQAAETGEIPQATTARGGQLWFLSSEGITEALLQIVEQKTAVVEFPIELPP